MNNFTPVQQKAIQTWTETRDSLLRQIGNYTVERDELRKSTAAEGLALADIQKSIAEAKGRLSELGAHEERRRTSVAIDVAELEVRKSRLEGECVEKEKDLEAAAEEHRLIVSATMELSQAHDTMKDQAAIVDSVVGQLIQTAQVHTSEMKVIMTDIKSISDEVITKGNENVKQTGIILEKLPRYIFELQRPIPVRRAYATPKGTIIRPEKDEQQ